MDNLTTTEQQPLKQPITTPIPVDTNSVTQRLQKELMALMSFHSLSKEGNGQFTYIRSCITIDPAERNVSVEIFRQQPHSKHEVINPNTLSQAHLEMELEASLDDKDTS
nr:probable ubiquitin-conjugating enzyme E2 C [Tanacetum cinerariifolium]